MYCNQCGGKVPDDVKFCPNCGALVGKIPEEPTAATAQEPESSFTFNPQTDFDGQPENKKPKMGKGKIALLAVLGVVVVAAIVALLNMNAIRAFFVRNSSPASFMQTVEGDAMGSMVDSLTNTYGRLLESVGKPGGFTGSVEVQLSDSTMTMLNSMLAQQGSNVDLSWLNNIVFNTQSQWNGNRSLVNVGVGLGDVQIATFQIVTDMEQMKMWLAVPELNQQYLVMDLSKVYSLDVQMGDTSAAMQQAQAMLQGMMEHMPKEEVVNSLLKKYIGIVLGCLNDVEKQETTLKLNGLEQTCTQLKTTITPENVLDIGQKVLSEVKSDAQIKEIILNMGTYAEEYVGAESAQVMYDQFVAQIDSLLKQLESQKDSLVAQAGDGVLIVNHYVDGQNRIIGRGLEMTNSDSSSAGSFHYYTVTQGDKFAFEADLGSVVITGDGTTSGNLLSGAYVLTTQGKELLKVEAEDWDEARWEQGAPCGTLRLSFGADALSQVPGAEEMAPMLSQMQLALTFDAKEDQADVKVSVLSSGMEIVSLHVSGSATEGGEISTPADGVDVEDQQALQQWAMGLDLNKLFENLSKAGVPQEYLQQLQLALFGGMG